MPPGEPTNPPSLAVIASEWGRIGCIGFGGPPAHIALLRELCVERRGWLDGAQFERALAAANLLPGPSSTQLAIYCAWRLGGAPGALVGGAAFILPGLALILALSVAFLASRPPLALRGAGAGAGAAVAAVAVRAGLDVARPIATRAAGPDRIRALGYALAGALAAALLGPWLVLVLLGCGAAELARRRLPRHLPSVFSLPIAAAPAGLGALAWTAFKVGALAFGGGFVIVPLMQADAVGAYHWMTHAQFLNAVALGQVTPGPVVVTVGAVGYAADGLPGGLLAAFVAFAPSFSFILIGAARFERLLVNARVQGFLVGAAPAAAGAIVGAALPLASALSQGWQFAVLAAAAALMFLLRLGVVSTLLLAACVGLLVGVLGGPLPH
jgi:chromate transporter